MINAQLPAVSISAFHKLAADNGDKTITVKGGKLESIPANLGFFGRLMNFIKSGSSGKMNAEARASFTAAMNKCFGGKVALSVMQEHGFDGKSGKPLTGRDVVKMVVDAGQRKALIDEATQRVKDIKADNNEASHKEEYETPEQREATKIDREAREEKLADAKDNLNKLRGVYVK